MNPMDVGITNLMCRSAEVVIQRKGPATTSEPTKRRTFDVFLKNLHVFRKTTITHQNLSTWLAFFNIFTGLILVCKDHRKMFWLPPTNFQPLRIKSPYGVNLGLRDHSYVSTVYWLFSTFWLCEHAFGALTILKQKNNKDS